MTDRKLQTTRQVASRTRIDRSTVAKWCKRGAFPGARLRPYQGHLQWVIPAASVQRFLWRRRAGARLAPRELLARRPVRRGR